MKFTKSLKLVVALVLMVSALLAFKSSASAKSISDYHIGDYVSIWGACYQLTEPIIVNGVVEGWYVIYAGPVCPSSPALGSVRGTSFLDKNANGKWDLGESVFGEGWYKVTDGGSWFTCGYVGGDSTFGVPVMAGTYYVHPVAPKGFKTTTPKVQIDVKNGEATLNANIGFAPDPSAKGEACDQYNPARP
jgi:hypothetical protein